MVEIRTSKNQFYNELEYMTESELESLIASDANKADDARYILGRLLLEGTFPDKVP